MTTGPLDFHTEPAHVSSSREEAIQRELQRRRALQAGRNHPQPPAVPAGFTSRAVWEAASHAADALAAAVRDAEYPADALVHRRADVPAHELARLAVDAASPLPPVTAVRLLLDAFPSIPGLFPELEASRATELVGSGIPTLGDDSVRDDFSDGAVPGLRAADTAWQCHVSYERLRRHLPISPAEQRALATYLPEPLVDDLIEARRLGVKAVPMYGTRALYLLARLRPGDVADDDLTELGWTDERARRDFWYRVRNGDVTVLDHRRGLDPEQLSLLDDLDRVKATRRVPSTLTSQTWLWRMLEHLTQGQAQSQAGQDHGFGSWISVRRLLRVLRVAHQQEIRGNTMNAVKLFEQVRAQAVQNIGVLSPAGWEARNIAAYLLVRKDRSGRYVKDALAEISPGLDSRHLPEDKLPSSTRRNLDHNRAVLRTLNSGLESGHVLNPFLVLGVPDQAPTDVWRSAWLTLRRDLDEDGEALANEAKDAVQAMERGHAAPGPFLVPLNQQRWQEPSAGAMPALGAAQPMPRRNPPATAEQKAYAMDQAAKGLINAARHHTGLPVLTGINDDPTSEGGNQ